jgi:hypothetical protein
MRDPLRIFLTVGLTLLVGGAALARAQGDLPRRSSGLTTSQGSGATTHGPLLKEAHPEQGHFASNTPYAPQQSLGTYEPPPAGYAPVFTQLVARHGSRALTSRHDIDYIKQLIAHARAANALTELGRQLEPQVVSFEQANVQLGYGNLSGRGVKEHQDLAARLLARLPEFFTSGAQAGHRIHVLTSGKDRAVDSGNNFVASLKAHMPALAPLVDPPVVNTDLLYFHKAPQNADYQEEWLAHDPTLAAKIGAIFYGARSRRQARLVLERLFTANFVDTLAAGRLLFVHPDTGDPVTFNEVDAVASLYSLYQVAPGLSEEGTWAFDRFISPWDALWFGYLKDAQDFYRKGPSFAGLTITFKMAQVLQDDFFNAVEAIRRNHSTLLAELRFAHAEIVIPLAALMKLPHSDRQVPVEETYTYSNNPWSGAVVTPYAVNIQWDVYTNSAGDYLIKMLYNERETPFKAACASIRDGSRYYRFDELKRCYGYE